MSRMDFLTGVRRGGRPTIGCPIGRAGYGLRFCIRVIRAICGEFYFGADSRLLFLAEFLESGIAAQRIPDRVEPKKGRRNGAVIGRL
jgi:hypothetical protein